MKRDIAFFRTIVVLFEMVCSVAANLSCLSCVLQSWNVLMQYLFKLQQLVLHRVIFEKAMVVFVMNGSNVTFLKFCYVDLTKTCI